MNWVTANAMDQIEISQITDEIRYLSAPKRKIYVSLNLACNLGNLISVPRGHELSPSNPFSFMGEGSLLQLRHYADISRNESTPTWNDTLFVAKLITLLNLSFPAFSFSKIDRYTNRNESHLCFVIPYQPYKSKKEDGNWFCPVEFDCPTHGRENNNCKHVYIVPEEKLTLVKPLSPLHFIWKKPLHVYELILENHLPVLNQIFKTISSGVI